MTENTTPANGPAKPQGAAILPFLPLWTFPAVLGGFLVSTGGDDMWSEQSTYWGLAVGIALALGSAGIGWAIARRAK